LLTEHPLHDEVKRKLVDLPTAIHFEQSAIGTREE